MAAPARKAFSARPGRVSSWLSAFAASATRIALRSERVTRSAAAGIPTALAKPGVERGRATGEGGVEQLAAAVEEAADVASGDAVAERELALLDPAAGADGVDRRADLATEPRRERKARLARRRRERALARERLACLEPAERLDEGAGSALRDPEAAAAPPREGRDREVDAAVSEPPEVALEVGVAEEQRSRRGLAFRKRERLALAQAREADDAGAGPLRDGGSRVAGAVVRDEELGSGEGAAKLRDRRPDARLLVPGRDQDGERLSHPCRRVSARAAAPRCRRTPSPRTGRGMRRRAGARAPAGRPVCRCRRRSTGRPRRRP